MQIANCCLCYKMLNRGVRRVISQQLTAMPITSTNFVATSSNFLLMEQENDKETKKDFRKILKLLERNPTQKRKNGSKMSVDSDFAVETKKETGKREEEEYQRNWKEHIGKSLHKHYEDYATRKNMEGWKQKARRDTFCYMRDRNLVELVGYAHRYIEQLMELNGKTNRRTFEDNELIVVVLKFVMKELLKGADDVRSPRNQPTNTKDSNK